MVGASSTHVFRRVGDEWQLEAVLPRNGMSAAISGERMVLGNTHGYDSKGEAYVFHLEDGSWSERGIVRPTVSRPGSSHDFGEAVAVAGDSVYAGDPSNGNGFGGIYVFGWEGVSWDQTLLLSHSWPPYEYFGNTLEVGAGYLFAAWRGTVEVYKRGLSLPSAPSAETESVVSRPYPNPTSGAAALTVSLAEPQHVRASVYDTLGRCVEVVYDGFFGAGTHAVPLDGEKLGPGLYVVLVEAGSSQVAHRLAVVR